MTGSTCQSHPLGEGCLERISLQPEGLHCWPLGPVPHGFPVDFGFPSGERYSSRVEGQGVKGISTFSKDHRQATHYTLNGLTGPTPQPPPTPTSLPASITQVKAHGGHMARNGLLLPMTISALR